MYESKLKPEFVAKAEAKEIERMWRQIVWLSKGLGLAGVLYATHTMPLFALVSASVVGYVIYKINAPRWKQIKQS